MLDHWQHEHGPELLTNILYLPKKKTNISVEEKEWIAAQLLAASEGLISTAQGMKAAKIEHPTKD